MVMGTAGFIASLEADYRQLSSDARRSEGFVGLFASTDHPEIKDAAERAVLRLRSLSHGHNAKEQLASNCKDLFRPLELASATKAPKLVGQALLIAQKLLANGVASPSAGAATAEMVASAARLSDETVQLRSLQTALTLLQAHEHPRTLVELGALLGACFGCLGGKGHRGAVTTTAMATVRQVLVLLVSYIGEGGDVEDVLAKTLSDLCAVAAGEEPTWLQTPSLPRAQVLELLDFVLKTDPVAFHKSTILSSIVGRRLPDLLRPQLRDHLTAGVTSSSFATAQFSSFRAALECTQTLLVTYSSEVLDIQATGSLVEVLLAALLAAQPDYQRLAALHVVARLLSNATFLNWFGGQLDEKNNGGEESSRARLSASASCPKQQDESSSLVMEPSSALSVQALVAACQQVLQSIEDARDPEDEPLLAGIELVLRARPGSLVPDVGTSAAALASQKFALAAVALEALAGYAAALEELVQHSSSSTSGDDSAHSKTCSNSSTSNAVARALLESTGSSLLTLFRRLLGLAPIEMLLQILLSAHQSLLSASTRLGLYALADPCFGALCELSLAAERTGQISSVSFTTFSESIASCLTPRNLACARALMGAVHKLSTYLTPENWAAAAKALTTLDRRLQASMKSTAAGGVNGAAVTSSNGGGGVLLPSSDRENTTSMRDDAEALASSLTALYASTSAMKSEAVLRLLLALQEISLEEVRAASTVVVAQDRAALCALSRVTEVLLVNMFRLQEFWALFLGHVLEIMAAACASGARVLAVEALGQVVSGALGRLGGGKEEEDVRDGGSVDTRGARRQEEPDAGVVPSSSAQSPQTLPSSPNYTSAVMEAGLEHMLLVSLESVYSAEHAPEARHAVLRALLVVLQRHGERLHEGWGAVFRLLAAVPDTDDPVATDLGFQAVQLIAGDYAAGLGPARLRRCLEVAAAYGVQQDDMNISLTTISILWNVADLVGRAMPNSDDKDNIERRATTPRGSVEHSAAANGAHGSSDSNRLTREEEPSSASHDDEALGFVLSHEEGAEILEIIFLALQNLASDLRPEIRNSGLRTLFGVVMSQWDKLGRQRWETALWEMLFPLLRHAFHMSVTSSKEEADPGLLGQSKGEAVHLVVHHSHNSEAKQWDETVVLALSGMTRILRAHLAEIIVLVEGQAGWEEMMVIVESCLAGARKRVALAALSTLTTLLTAHGGDESVLSTASWERLLRAVSVGVEAACNPTCRVPVAVRSDLVGGALSGVHSAARSRGDDDAVCAVHAWLARLARHPWSDEDTAHVGTLHVPGVLPPVQKAVLALLGSPTLAPEPTKFDLWDDYLRAIVSLLNPLQLLQHVCSMLHSDDPGAAPLHGIQPSQSLVGRFLSSATLSGPGGETQLALSAPLLHQVLELIVQAYENAPVAPQANLFGELVGALGSSMALRHVLPDEELWRSSSSAFNVLVPVGLQAVLGSGDIKLAGTTWAALAAALEGFLLGKFTEEELPCAKQLQRAQELLQRGIKDDENLAGGEHSVELERTASRTSTVSMINTNDLDAVSSDSELEVAVVDTLSNTILAAAPDMPQAALNRFVAVIDAGVVREGTPHDPLSSGFSQTCLRKLYVLASGGGPEEGAESSGRAPVAAAAVALGTLLRRCSHMLRSAARGGAVAAGEARYGGRRGRPRLDEMLCMLELLATLTVDAAVLRKLSDLAAEDERSDGPWAQLFRRAADQVRGRQALSSQAHLIAIYPSLVHAVVVPEAKTREAVRDVLLLAGREMGIAEG